MPAFSHKINKGTDNLQQIIFAKFINKRAKNGLPISFTLSGTEMELNPQWRIRLKILIQNSILNHSSVDLDSHFCCSWIQLDSNFTVFAVANWKILIEAKTWHCYREKMEKNWCLRILFRFKISDSLLEWFKILIWFILQKAIRLFEYLITYFIFCGTELGSPDLHTTIISTCEELSIPPIFN